MDQDMPSIRHHLAVLARRKKARTLGWPRDWRPSEICNPEDGQPFTPAGAWEFIVHLLEERHDIAIEPVTLDNPPGATGYAMHIPFGQHVLYIKIQLGAGQIIGRSFHYSHT